VREFAGQFTVVGEQEHTRGVAVQTAYGINALGTCVFHQFHHRLAVLGVVAGGYVVLGLVEQHINLLLDVHGLVVEYHAVRALYLGTQLGYDLSVHAYQSGRDECVGLATAANTGVSQVAVQADSLVGIILNRLVLYLLLQAVFGMRVIVCGAWLALESALALLETSLLAGLETSLLAGLIASFTRLAWLAGLVASFAWLSGLVASFAWLTWLIASLSRLSWLIASFAWLTWLITAFSRCIGADCGSAVRAVGTGRIG
jgi:hypothetical protein